MNTIRVKTSKEYDIIIDSGILRNSGELCKRVVSGKRILILTDTNVAKLYAQETASAFKNSGFDVTIYTVKAGEKSKSCDNLLKIVSHLVSNHFERDDTLVTLGGGVVGDLGGFAAATYLRGINLVHIPTTLLACVDSSIGGKTGVNIKYGKNLFGSFYQPSLVICDTDLISTLPEKIKADGIAEIIKYGLMADPDILKLIESDTPDYSTIIGICAKLKAETVACDEHDTGLRQILNFGHTVGHAVEACSKYKISHGYAITIGMSVIIKAQCKLNKLDNSVYERFCNIAEKFKLPLDCNFSINELKKYIYIDKKRKDDKIALVILKEVGTAEVITVNDDELTDILEKGLK